MRASVNRPDDTETQVKTENKEPPTPEEVRIFTVNYCIE